MKDGLVLTFGAGRADLNPQTDGALRALVHGAPPFDTTTFTLTSSAAAQPDDPSTPRRLALARALAVRSVMIAEGVASPRITVKVLGSVPAGPTDEAADRVDIAVASVKPGAAPPPPSGGSKP